MIKPISQFACSNICTFWTCWISSLSWYRCLQSESQAVVPPRVSRPILWISLQLLEKSCWKGNVCTAPNSLTIYLSPLMSNSNFKVHFVLVKHVEWYVRVDGERCLKLLNYSAHVCCLFDNIWGTDNASCATWCLKWFLIKTCNTKPSSIWPAQTRKSYFALHFK